MNPFQLTCALLSSASAPYPRTAAPQSSSSAARSTPCTAATSPRSSPPSNTSSRFLPQSSQLLPCSRSQPMSGYKAKTSRPTNAFSLQKGCGCARLPLPPATSSSPSPILRATRLQNLDRRKLLLLPLRDALACRPSLSWARIRTSASEIPPDQRRSSRFAEPISPMISTLLVASIRICTSSSCPITCSASAPPNAAR
jgi:hypothetical protein